MAIDRISTFALHQLTLKNASQKQADLADLQTQLSSGLKSQTFQGIANQAEQFLQLEAKISRSDLYVANNKLVETRLNITDQAISQIIDVAGELKNAILLRRNNTNPGGSFQSQLENFWKSITQQLNTQLEGRYIFSGGRTDAPAVATDTFPVLQESGVPDTGYYQGDGQDIAAQADDGISMTYNVRADDPGFQKIFAGLSMASQGDSIGDDDDLAQAYDLVEEGLRDIIATQSTVNSNKVAISQINQRHQSLQVYWKSVKEDIGNADLVSVSTQVAIDQGILQATFQAFAKINSLRLVDFLR